MSGQAPAAAALNVLYNLATLPDLPWAVLIIMLYATGMSLAMPSISLLNLELYPRNRGMVSSLQGFIHTLGAALAAGLLSPWLAHSPLLLAFSFSALSYSSLLRGTIEWPDTKAIVVAFLTSLLFFLQLRIADEFKDYEEDARFRPYRPVPRGLVNLHELGLVGVLSAITQLALAAFLQPALIVLLLLAWTYLALMSVEFFARDWLKARPITYMWTHMLIVPLVDYYATACDWLAQGAAQPSGLRWFLLVSFCNGIVIEVGRKLRAPTDEEDGVQTYTVLWGRQRAVLVWLGAMLATASFAVLAALSIAFVLPVAIALAGLWLVSARARS